MVDVWTGCVVALWSLSTILFGQGTGPTGPDTEYAPCLEGQLGVRHYESPRLVSPDGRWRAYASVEARPDRTFGCSNTSTLLVQGPGEETFHAVNTIKPSPYLQGNGLKLIAWSPQRHLLALVLYQWQYMSDAGDTGALVYDADRKRMFEPDLAALFARKYAKKECAFGIRNVLGFDPQNRVLLSASDWIEDGDDEPAPATRCLGSPGIWALDVESNQLEFVKRSEPE